MWKGVIFYLKSARDPRGRTLDSRSMTVVIRRGEDVKCFTSYETQREGGMPRLDTRPRRLLKYNVPEKRARVLSLAERKARISARRGESAEHKNIKRAH